MLRAAFGRSLGGYSESNTIGNPSGSYSYDGNGRRVVRTVSAQTTVYVYDAFGALAAAYSNGGIAGRSASQFGSDLDNVNQKFTRQERDSESLLDFFQARYFGGALGRFLSPDPRNEARL